VTPVWNLKKVGWKQDLTGMTTYDELPVELKSTFTFIEKS
jgi:adenylosuccinate synthase